MNHRSALRPALAAVLLTWASTEVRATNVRGTVWIDLDCDGRVDSATETTFLVGFTAALVDAEGNPLVDRDGVEITAVTNADGVFQIDGLSERLDETGMRTLRLLDTTLEGHVLGVIACRNFPEEACGEIRVDEAEIDVDFDQDSTIRMIFFGFCPVEPTGASLRGTVFCDVDDDGHQGVGEPGIAGVSVRRSCILEDGSESTDTTSTGGDGAYRFDDVPAGECTVAIDPSTAPAGKEPGRCPLARDVTVATGDAVEGVDFCLVDVPPPPPGPGEVSGTVFCDLDDDGELDAGEPGIAGAGVDLSCVAEDGSVSNASTTTGADGSYRYTDVPAGECTVSVDVATVSDGKEPGRCATSIDVDVLPDSGVTGVDFCFVTPDEPGAEGCSPGYWKQSHHFGNWPAPYEPSTPFAAVFADVFPDATLLDVLERGGGRLYALGRHAVAALLNAASPHVDHPWSVDDVVRAFDDAAASSSAQDVTDLIRTLEGLEQPCPLGRAEGDPESDDDTPPEDAAAPIVAPLQGGESTRRSERADAFRLQTTYAAEDVATGPVSIDALILQRTGDVTERDRFDRPQGNVRIYLSVAASSGDGLSRTFDSNAAVDPVIVFDGEFYDAGEASGAPAEYEFTFDPPYLYSPTEGDLLVEIVSTTGFSENLEFSVKTDAGWTVIGEPCATEGSGLEPTVLVAGFQVSSAAPSFTRGDSNGDGARDLADAIHVLRHLFLSSGEITCADAADADDDGRLGLTDGIYLLDHLFRGGRDLPAPLACGEDPSADALGCERSPACAVDGDVGRPNPACDAR